jgi:hypothetical protein
VATVGLVEVDVLVLGAGGRQPFFHRREAGHRFDVGIGGRRKWGGVRDEPPNHWRKKRIGNAEPSEEKWTAWTMRRARVAPDIRDALDVANDDDL